MIYSIYIIGLLLYGRSIWYSPSVDDIAHLKNRDKWSKGLFNVKHVIRHWLYGAGLFKNLKLDHLFKILLFSSICSLIYIGFGSNTISYITAMLYLVHPANHQISLWLNGRRYAFNCLLVLLIWTFKPWGIVAYPFVALFQINGILAPLLYINEYPLMILTIPIILLYGDCILVRHFISRYKSMPTLGVQKTLSISKLPIIIKSIGYYIRRGLFPVSMTLYPQYLETMGVDRKGTKDALRLSYDFWLSLFSISLLITAFWFFPTVRLGLAWFTLFILQWCNAITVTQNFSDRYLSLALIGLLHALCSLIGEFSYTTQLIEYTAFFIYYASQTSSSMIMYKDMYCFYAYQEGMMPMNRTLRLNNFNRFFKHKRYIDSYKIIAECVLKFPDDIRMTINIANNYEKLGLKRECLKYINISRGLLGDQEPNMIPRLSKAIDKVESNLTKEGW